MHSNIKNLTGQRFGKLTVLKLSNKKGKNRHAYWECKCDCGVIKAIQGSSLIKGTRSCGCIAKEINGARVRTHGLSNSQKKLYYIWGTMKKRCNNPQNRNYKNYGGRGISICESWNSSFQKFYDDMSPTYKEGLSLDRIDNNQGYSLENCRWATKKVQGRNKRNNTILIINGKQETLQDLAELNNINPRTLRNRVFRSGWSVEKSLTFPIKNRSS